MRTIVVLFAFVACALADGDHHGFKFPQSCKDAAESTKQCFETNVQAKGVNNIKMEDIKKCFESCPHTKGEGKGEHSKSKESGSSSNEGTWAKAKGARDAFRVCIAGKLGDKMETCIAGKITYAVAAPKESKGGPGGPGGRHGGHGHGGPGGFRGGNPLKTLKDKVAKCGADTEQCVKNSMGPWYDKLDELSQILCDASKACPRNDDQCKTDLKAGKAARCACKTELSAEVTAAKTECAAGAGDSLDRVAKRAGEAKGEHDGCDGNDSKGEEHHERENPFCSA